MTKNKECRQENKAAYLADGLKRLGYQYIESYYGHKGIDKEDRVVQSVMNGAIQELQEALTIQHNMEDTAGLSEENVVQDKQEAADCPLNWNHVLIQSMMICKNNGVLPWYIAKLLAFMLLGKNHDSSAALQESVQENGVKNTIITQCSLENEPEIVQLVADQCALIEQDKVEDEAKVKLMKQAFETGFNNEKKYGGCAQCTLLSMFDLFGRRNDLLFQSASALAGGMGLCGDGACGGYSGGIMYMGLIVGRRLDYLDNGDNETKAKANEMAQVLRKKYLETYGSVICANLHKKIFGRSFDLRVKQEKDMFKQAGAHIGKCTALIGMSCAWISEIIYDYGYAE